MTNKQTAVEWLVEQLTPSITLQQKYIDEIKEQAKEMEKEQMFKALIYGKDVHRSYYIELEFNEYYNKTFKSE
jgi:hypothetical protein